MATNILVTGGAGYIGSHTCKALAAAGFTPITFDNMFVDRLFETVPTNQIEALCDGSEENEGALALAYVMFLESARMEKQMAEDLAACDLPPGEDGSDVAAEVCRRLARVEEKRRQTGLKKAAAYQHAHHKAN